MLHIINKSPFSSNSFATCLRFIDQQDVILLIEDGVYAALANSNLAATLATILATHPIYALTEDIQARGIANKLNPAVKLIDYAGFVELTLTYHPSQTWS